MNKVAASSWCPAGLQRPGGLELTEHGLAFCSLPAGARILDVGCGAGEAAGYLARHHRYNSLGLDISLPALHDARRLWPALALLQAQGSKLPLGGRLFDAVLAECSLCLMEDGPAALGEFARILRPGGWLILNDLYSHSDETGALSGLPARPILLKQVEAAGFSVIQWEDHTAALRRFAAQRLWAGQKLSLPALEGARTTRPGYYLLVAQSQPVSSCTGGQSWTPQAG